MLTNTTRRRRRVERAMFALRSASVKRAPQLRVPLVLASSVQRAVAMALAFGMTSSRQLADACCGRAGL